MTKMRSGFTLVELIIGLSIFSLLIGSMFSALIANCHHWQRLTSSNQQLQLRQVVFARIKTDIRNASQLLSCSSRNELVLLLDGETVSYSSYKNKIRRKKNNYSSYLTTENQLGPLYFSYDQNKLVHIQLEAASLEVALRI